MMILPRIDSEWLREKEEFPYQFHFKLTLFGKLCRLLFSTQLGAMLRKFGVKFSYFDHVVCFHNIGTAGDLDKHNTIYTTNCFIKLDAIVLFRPSGLFYELSNYTKPRRREKFPRLHRYLHHCSVKSNSDAYTEQFYYDPFRAVKRLLRLVVILMERHGGVDVEPVYKLGSNIVTGFRILPSPDTPFSKVNIDDDKMVTRMINAYNNAPFYKQELLKKIFKSKK